MTQDPQQLKLVREADVYKGEELAGHPTRTALGGVRFLKIPVAQSQLVSDRRGAAGLLVERFDRLKGEGGKWRRLPLEDGTQLMGLPPASKRSVNSEEVAEASAGRCQAPVLARRTIYLRFVFAWLTGNGDLHAMNLSVLGRVGGGFAVAPVYEVLCTLFSGDETLALTIGGKTKNLKFWHWAEFGTSLGLPEKATTAANALAAAAASSINLESLPFHGSQLRGAQRELGIRRPELVQHLPAGGRPRRRQRIAHLAVSEACPS